MHLARIAPLGSIKLRLSVAWRPLPTRLPGLTIGRGIRCISLCPVVAGSPGYSQTRNRCSSKNNGEHMAQGAGLPAAASRGYRRRYVFRNSPVGAHGNLAALWLTLGPRPAGQNRRQPWPGDWETVEASRSFRRLAPTKASTPDRLREAVRDR